MPKPMNSALLGLEPSAIRRFTALAKETPGCLLLTLGEPEADTPRPVREAAVASLLEGDTHYPPNNGQPWLREGISRFEAERGIVYRPEEVLVTCGATEGIFCALTALLNLALLARVMPGPVRYASAFAKPLIASLLMGAAAWGSYGLLHRILSGITAFQRLDEATGAVLFSRTGYAVAVFASIAVAGCIYLVLVVALRAISREDLALMPKGEKIARILHI